MTVAETARFEGGTQIWCTSTEDSLNLGGRTSHRWNLRLMPSIWCAGCPGLSLMVSAKFTHIKCVSQPEIANNSLKTPIFWGFTVIQGHRCGHHRKARQQCLLWWAASLYLCATVLTPIVVKLRFLRGYTSLMVSFEGNLLTQRHQITSLETRDQAIMRWKPGAWFGTGSWHPRRTDGQNSRS